MNKFKPGDRIRLVSGEIDGHRDIGEEFDVVEKPSRVSKFSVAYRDRKGSTSWAPEEFFTLVRPTPAIVAVIRNRKPAPSARPVVHSSTEAATAEARRLARQNPGQEFAVFQRVAGVVAEVTLKDVA